MTASSPHLLMCFVRLIRPKQWVKNGFVLAPLLFANQFHSMPAVTAALIAFSTFCVAASTVYVLNDILDAESDKLHPKKSLSRPIAAGMVSIPQAAAVLAGLLGFVALGLIRLPSLMPIVVFYILLNVAYALYLKKIPVLDVFTIAIGFVLRVVAGAAAISVPISSWMLITTLCLAIYLASFKRYQELVGIGSASRSVLNEYSPELVKKYADISAVLSLVFYSMFVVATREELIISIPLVIFGIFRYYYIVDKKNQGESPTEALYSDLPLAITVLAWVCVCVVQLSKYSLG